MGADEAVQENDTTITSENSRKTEKSEIKMNQETTDAMVSPPEDDLPAVDEAQTFNGEIESLKS